MILRIFPGLDGPLARAAQANYSTIMTLSDYAAAFGKSPHRRAL
jgi:hypothetical protein